MFYVPLRRETGTMWDTWLYHHAGTYYLFYLARTGGSGTTSRWPLQRTACTGRNAA